MKNDDEDMTNDEETWDGMEDYDEGRSPDPTDEDALDYDDNDYSGCWPDGEDEDQD